ncbi:unnamed protein product [Rhizoctonia solani]|uniref:Uncharacterized protein n=1 Tax=Rhizoctonia solani TaxID=456999 RepID=A0A8H3GLB0_9AGAM|nr:unnamed protein product [Rhizoctonia solani]
MRTYGGFYVSPTSWREWVTSRGPPYKNWGAPAAERMVHDALWEKNIGHLFRVTIVPIPVSESQEHDWALMVYTRRNSKKPVYFCQRLDSDAEKNGKQMLQDTIGLTAAEWKNLYFNEQATEEPYESRFVEHPSGENN